MKLTLDCESIFSWIKNADGNNYEKAYISNASITGNIERELSWLKLTDLNKRMSKAHIEF